MHAFLAWLGRSCARHHWIVIAGWLALVAGLAAANNRWGGDYVNDYTVPGSQSDKGTQVIADEFPGQSTFVGQLVFHALFLIFFSVVAALIPLVSAVFSVLAALSIIGLLAAVATFPTTGPTLATLLGLGVAIDYGLFQVARHRENLAGSDAYVAAAASANTHSGMAILVAGSTVIIAMLGLYIAGLPFISALGVSAALGVATTMVAALTLIPAFLGLSRGAVRAMRRGRPPTAEPGSPAVPPPAGAEPTGHVAAPPPAGGEPGGLAASPTPPAAGGEPDGSRDAAAARRVEPGATGYPPRSAPGTPTGPVPHPAHEHGWFARWGRYVSRRPWPWAIGAVVVLLVITIPLIWIDFGQLDPGTDPTSDTDRRAYDLIAQGFGPGANGPLTVVVTIPPGTDPTTLLGNTQLALQQEAGVASVTPPLVNPQATAAIIDVVPTTGPRDAATTDLLHRIRDDVLPTVPAPAYVTGQTAGYDDFTARTVQRLPWLILAVVVLSLLLLTTAFRSLVIGIQAALMNLLSVGAAYGVVVAVFQWGWAASLIGVDVHLSIPAYVPMIMFAVVFGLSMDYEVFLMSRVHEAYLHTRDTRRSVALGIGVTARVITTAALIMIVVFISFVADPDPTIKMLAVGMAVSVLLDASIVRMILVPAILAILGDRSWWIPRWLDRILPRLDIEGAQPPQPELQGTRR